MIGWVAFGLTLLLWLLSKHRNMRYRLALTNFIILLYLNTEVYKDVRAAFSSALSNDAPVDSPKSLWLWSQTLVEENILAWSKEVPASIGVGEILWRAAAGRNRPQNHS